MKNLILLLLFSCFSLMVWSQAGTTQTEYLEYYNPDGNQYRVAWAWNSANGKAVRYYYDAGAWNRSEPTLPDNDVVNSATGAPGEIMMKYLEYYNPSRNQYRVVWAWNTRTGQAARFYYDAGAWNQSEATLPKDLFEKMQGEVGEIQMEYEEYYNPSGNQYRVVWVTNTLTGATARFYYDNGSWNKSSVALPANPLD